MWDIRQRFRSYGLRIQFVIILAVALSPAGVIAVTQMLSVIDNARRLAQEDLRSKALAAISQEHDALISMRERLFLRARYSMIRALKGEKCDEATIGFARSDHRFSSAYVFDASGHSVCGPKERILDIKDVEVWRNFISAPGLTIGTATGTEFSDEPVMIALVPISGETGVLGAFASGIRLAYLQDLMTSDPSDRVAVALVDREGHLIADNAFQGTKPKSWMPVKGEISYRGHERSIDREDRSGVARLYFLSPLLDGAIWVVATAPAPRLVQIMLGPTGLGLISPLLMLLIAVLVAFFGLERLVIRHVLQMGSIAKSIGEGARSIETAKFTHAPIEFRRLGEVLETMTGQLKKRELALQQSVVEKEALLVELHHRVKNNLQMISSLMNIQLRRTAEPGTRAALRIVQDRIHGLALVHQTLYARSQGESVALHDLIQALAEYLATTLRPDPDAKTITLSLIPIETNAYAATPIALFVTEAIANAYKHALSIDTSGWIGIEMVNHDQAHFRLSITNSQVAGSSPSVTGAGIGMRLMQGFADQIGARLDHSATAEQFCVSMIIPYNTEKAHFTTPPM